MICGHDQIYRLDHAVAKTQKVILKAFGMMFENKRFSDCARKKRRYKININILLGEDYGNISESG